MIPFLAIDKKSTREQIRTLKQHYHLLTAPDRKIARQQIAEYEAKHNPQPQPPIEHDVFYVASKRMLWYEQNSLCACPVIAEQTINGISRHATVSHEAFEEFTDWLEHYGCNWQEQ